MSWRATGSSRRKQLEIPNLQFYNKCLTPLHGLTEKFLISAQAGRVKELSMSFWLRLTRAHTEGRFRRMRSRHTGKADDEDMG
jgi:hypothetical protein